MRVEHLRLQLQAATRKETQDTTKWGKVVSIVQAEFEDGNLAEECTCQTVVLITKGRGDFQGICLLDVLWNMATGILSWNFTMDIGFQDTLYGLRLGRGMGTASIEFNPIKQLMGMGEVVLYEILLDLQKVYGDLDTDQCLGILEYYVMGIQSIWLLWTYWERITMVDKAGGYHAPP